jgi:hypothetical protein
MDPACLIQARKVKRELETMRIRLLGGFRVSVGARTTGEEGWRLKRARSLVKLLALSTGHRLHRDQIVERLWPDSSPGSAAPEAAGGRLGAAGQPDRRDRVGLLALAAHGGRGSPLVGPSLRCRPVISVRVVVQQHRWERAAGHAVSHHEQRHLGRLLPRHVLGGRLGEDGLAAGRTVVCRGVPWR